MARLRREHGLWAKRRKRFVVTTRSRYYTQAVALNLLQRRFSAPCPNRIRVGDVTFIPTREGRLYLAVLIDLYSRSVVGWARSARNDSALVCSALEMASTTRRPP